MGFTWFNEWRYDLSSNSTELSHKCPCASVIRGFWMGISQEMPVNSKKQKSTNFKRWFCRFCTTITAAFEWLCKYIVVSLYEAMAFLTISFSSLRKFQDKTSNKKEFSRKFGIQDCVLGTLFQDGIIKFMVCSEQWNLHD